MKIKITSNHNKIPEKLSQHIDMSYGLAYYDRSTNNIQNNNTFAAKVYSQLDKVLNMTNTNESNNSQKMTNTIINTMEHIGEKTNFLFTDKLKQIHIQITKDTLAYKIFKKFKKDNDNNRTKAFPSLYFLNIGEDSFNEFKPIIKEYGIEKTTQFILLHELSHNLEIPSYSEYNKEIKMKAFSLMPHLILRSNSKKEINKQLKNQNNSQLPNFIDISLAKNLDSFRMELYADTSALLMLRNSEMETGNYNKEKFENFTNQLIKIREKNFIKRIDFWNKVNKKNDTIFTEGDIVSSSLSHLTVLAMENINKGLPEDRILTHKEISEISIKKTYETMAKAIYVLNEDPHLKTQFTLLTQLSLDKHKINLNTSNINEKYSQTINEVFEIIPQEWKEQYKKKLEAINKTQINVNKDNLKIISGLMIDRPIGQLIEEFYPKPIKERVLGKIHELRGKFIENTISNTTSNTTSSGYKFK